MKDCVCAIFEKAKAQWNIPKRLSMGQTLGPLRQRQTLYLDLLALFSFS